MKRIIFLLVLAFVITGCTQFENIAGEAGYQGKLVQGCPNTETFGCISGKYYYAYNPHPNGKEWHNFVGPLQACTNINNPTCWCPLKGSKQVEEVNIFFADSNEEDWRTCGRGGLHRGCLSDEFYYAWKPTGYNSWDRLDGPISGCTTINNGNQEWCPTASGLIKTKLFKHFICYMNFKRINKYHFSKSSINNNNI